ncbi:MAG: DUF4855 domain-containing protein [Deltaproteobacteria bacterium]|nr:DUF4855 domain-containing protein [Deltaproteobacteria bacterium]
MELVYAVILIVGLILLGFHQNKKVKALEKHLEEQQKTLDRLKVYLDMFDPQQVQAWMKCKQDAIEEEGNQEIEKMCTWMAGIMQERFEAGHWKEREITAATDLIIRLLFHAPPSVRDMCIARMPNSMYRDAARKVVGRMPECDQFLPPTRLGLSPPAKDDERD